MFHFVKKIAYEKKINDLLRLKKKKKRKKIGLIMHQSIINQ